MVNRYLRIPQVAPSIKGILTAVGIGKNINEARKIAYQVANTVKYNNKFMRTDIALNYKEKK